MPEIAVWRHPRHHSFATWMIQHLDRADLEARSLRQITPRGKTEFSEVARRAPVGAMGATTGFALWGGDAARVGIKPGHPRYRHNYGS
jgi:hypothetical protein